MPNDFLDGMFGDYNEENFEPGDQSFDAGYMQELWDSSVAQSPYWYDFSAREQQEMHQEFLNRFTRGSGSNTRYAMETWIEAMGIEDYQFDWRTWREENGY